MREPTSKVITARLARILPESSKLNGSVCTEQALSFLSGRICAASLGKSTKLNAEQETALYNSLSHLLNATLTEELIRTNVHRVVANWHFIMEGMEVPVWCGERTDAKVIFIGVLRARTGSGDRPKYHVKFKLKSGLGAGIILCATLYESAMYRFLDKFSGARSFNCPAEEIAGMEARIVLSVTENVVTIHDWDCTTSQKAHNAKLAELRSSVTKCRRNIPCNTCKKNQLDYVYTSRSVVDGSFAA